MSLLLLLSSSGNAIIIAILTRMYSGAHFILLFATSNTLCVRMCVLQMKSCVCISMSEFDLYFSTQHTYLHTYNTHIHKQIKKMGKENVSHVWHMLCIFEIITKYFWIKVIPNEQTNERTFVSCKCISVSMLIKRIETHNTIESLDFVYICVWVSIILSVRKHTHNACTINAYVQKNLI